MSSDRARIVHVVTGLEGGGAERALFTLLQSGLQDRFDNHVISLGGAGHYGPKLEAIRISVQALGLREGVSSVTALRKLVKIVRDLEPAIIQGWMYHGNLAASVAAMVARRRSAVCWNVRQSLDAMALEKRGTKAVMQALRWWSGSPKAIIYNSRRALAQHQAYGFSAQRSLVIPNGFDPDRWRPDPVARTDWRGRLGLAPDEVVLGYVGRYHPVKDIPTFLRACSMALDAVPHFRVAMVGEGLTVENAAITENIAPALRGRIRLMGAQSDIERIMPAFDMLCLSSTAEGFPNVIGEAMASGLPCVATDVGDCAELLGGTGLIVPPGDPGPMAKAIRELAETDVARRVEMGKAARDRIVAAYGIDTTVRAYMGLYDSIMKREK